MYTGVVQGLKLGYRGFRVVLTQIITDTFNPNENHIGGTLESYDWVFSALKLWKKLP